MGLLFLFSVKEETMSSFEKEVWTQGKVEKL